MYRISSILAFVMTAPMLAIADEEAVRIDLKVLCGTWVAVAGESQGKEIPKEELPVQWTFKTGGEAVFFHRTKGDEARYSYSIDPSKKPKWIDLTYSGPSEALKGKKQYGVYKLDEGNLTLCLTNPGAAEKDRPPEFSTKDQDLLLLKLTRVEEKK